MRELNTKAKLLRSLHDDLLVLPNAWDVASAVVIARAGARAIATTSAGVAWSLGRADGQRLSRAEMLDAVRRIAEAVDLPVTADLESGYGRQPDDVAVTVRGAVAAGAVGMNLEDSWEPGQPLFTAADQADRIAAGRAAAAGAGVPDFVINARCDVHLFAVGESQDRHADVIERGRAYAEAGADCLFVPGLTDLGELRAIVDTLPIGVSVMTGPGAPTTAEFAAAGVCRVSAGGFLSLAAYDFTHHAATRLLHEGTVDTTSGAIGLGELQSWLR